MLSDMALSDAKRFKKITNQCPDLTKVFVNIFPNKENKLPVS
jgi:hypothetical protein